MLNFIKKAGILISALINHIFSRYFLYYKKPSIIFNKNNSKISIVIPFRDEPEVLIGLIESILHKTNYLNYHLYLIDNQSSSNDTFELIKKYSNHSKISFIEFNEPFNFSKICNEAVAVIESEFIVFLNNDMLVINPEWLDVVLENLSNPKIGVVGGLLLYPDGTIQHSGMVYNRIWPTAHHIYRKLDPNNWFVKNFVNKRRLFKSVTGACLATKKSIYTQVGGMDEVFKIIYNDVDYCLKVAEIGYEVVYDPNIKFLHLESKTRGQLGNNDELTTSIFKKRWQNLNLNDYNIKPIEYLIYVIFKIFK